MVRGVYPPYTLSGPTTKKKLFLCASSLSYSCCEICIYLEHIPSSLKTANFNISIKAVRKLDKRRNQLENIYSDNLV